MHVQAAKQVVGRGLYFVTMAIDKKPGTHYAILDVGNVLGQLSVYAPTIYHLRPEGVMSTRNLSQLISVQRITDEARAVTRFAAALSRPAYDLFTNNCEHFARFVAFGERSSHQVVWLGAGVAAAVGVAAVLNRD